MKWREWKYAKALNASQDNFKDFEICFIGVCLSDQTTNLYSPPTFYSTKLFLDFSSFFLLFYLIFSTTLSTFVFFFSLNFLSIFATNKHFFFLWFSLWTYFLLTTPTLVFLNTHRLPKHNRKQEVTIIVSLTLWNKGRLVFRLRTWDMVM